MRTKSHYLILASSSPYRQEQLKKLGVSFDAISPDIDETRQVGETPAQLVERLSLEKAQKIQSQYPTAIVVGSDQVAYIKEETSDSDLRDIEVLSKPHTIANARAQLLKCSGKSVRFVTGLCCLSPQNEAQVISEYVDVSFRVLSSSEINNYIDIEKPLDCAGSFKVEGLGITLFEKVESSDPNTLIGLPIIALNKMLIKTGYNILLN
ncbi:Maf family protein [Glaciecola sp. MF2-115]|uniref:Maf family protein n=1 Tax=Glaciecola sp. MF2-115 TaxID=3384827 RepID=UPI0039A1DD5B